MGTRSMNYLVTKVGTALSPTVAKYLVPNHEISDVRGDLFVWESNFTPMFGRTGKNCTADLEEEVAIQQFVGSLPASDFLLRRAGDECGTRGTWLDHGFYGHEQVQRIEALYEKRTKEDMEKVQASYSQ